MFWNKYSIFQMLCHFVAFFFGVVGEFWLCLSKQGDKMPAVLTKSASLNNIHLKELTKKRGLTLEWVEVNCRSVDAREATSLLGYKAQSGGIWLEGANYQGQFKPDSPWKGPDEKKAAKYRSVSDIKYDAILPKHPTNPHYWQDLEALKSICYHINGHPCLLISEGPFKAIAGCINDLPTIAVLGVEMGLTSSKADPQGKRYLVDALEVFARANFGFIVGFDADCATKSEVVKAQRKLVHQLQKFGVPVYSITGLWTVDEGKGMDDYIQKNGADKFREEVLRHAELVEEWEKQFIPSFFVEKPPKPAQMAINLEAVYQEKLIWCDQKNAWYCYETDFPGVWSEESENVVKATLLAELEARLNANFSNSYLNDVEKLLKYKLLQKKLNQPKGLIALEDGVLDPKTLELHPHSPDYHFTSSLPIKWSDRKLGCDPIKQWMLQITQGDQRLVEVLRALLNCVVLSRTDYQRHLEAVGPGGTGKGTFFRLATMLVGERNVYSTTLKALEGNRFELEAATEAKLLLITEAEKYSEEVNTLKALTGQDGARIEAKGRQQKCGDNRQFSGFIMISANQPMLSSDYTSGFARRRLILPFLYQIPESERCGASELEAKFAPFLAGLLEWVLTMPEEKVRNLILETNTSVPYLAEAQKNYLCDTNPLADWLDTKIVIDPNAKTYMGVDDGNKVASWLYANYASYTRSVNNRVMGLRSFSTLIKDLCCNQLKLPGVSKGHDRNGSFFQGLRIRSELDSAPCPITGVNLVMAEQEPEQKTVMAETLASDGCDGLKAEINNTREKISNQNLEDNTSIYIDVETPCKDSEATLTQRIIANWENTHILGEIILSVADTDELRKEVQHYTADQLKRIKDAANEVWKCTAQSYAEYCGEKVEPITFGNARNWKVRFQGSDRIVSAARGNIRPWLGI